MKINMVNLLGITYNEIIISNLIVGLINNSYNFRIPFLKNILGIKDAQEYKVHSEVKLALSGEVPDIIVVAESADKVIVSIIESKLEANKAHSQTIIYSEKVCIEEILCDSEICKEKKLEIKYVYLNLIPNEDDLSKEFINKTYKDIVEEVWVDIEDEGLDRIYKDFCSEMIDFYRGLKVSKGDKLLNFLLENDDKERRFIRFREMLLSIKYPDELKIDFFGKLMGKEVEGFTTKISKSQWIGKEAKWVNGIYVINEETYNIHLELTFDVTSKQLKIDLHYEIYPYVARNNLQRYTSRAGVEKFEGKRDKFRDIIYSKVDKIENSNINKRNGVNTIMYIVFPLNEETTIEEFKYDIVNALLNLSKIVDETFEEM